MTKTPPKALTKRSPNKSTSQRNSTHNTSSIHSPQPKSSSAIHPQIKLKIDLSNLPHRKSSSQSSTPQNPSPITKMDLTKILKDLRASTSYSTTLPLLSKAKLALLNLNALTPQPTTDAKTLLIAREVFEIGALASIRAEKPDEFTRFVHQLTPFYELPAERLPGDKSERNKITGLYLLLLLTLGNYAGFHTELEGLELRGVQGAGMVEDDKYLGYPIRLERWLMEGSYDLVWKAMASGTVPCEEYGVFSNILTSQIRSEIASCSEKAYPSLPISSTKNLLFLESEGAVIQFAEHRQWVVRDGRIYFPNQNVRATLDEGGVEKEASQVAIENTLGYARELETIV